MRGESTVQGGKENKTCLKIRIESLNPPRALPCPLLHRAETPKGKEGGTKINMHVRT